MNIPNPRPSRTEGSSLVLAILVGVAAIVIIALMMKTSSIGKKEIEKGKQGDAIAESMDVFNKFDSVMEKSPDAPPAGKVEEKPPVPQQPMHLLPPPPSPDKQKGEKGSPPSAGVDGNPKPGLRQLTGIGFFEMVTGADLAAADEANEGPEEPVRFFSDGPAANLLLPKPELEEIEMPGNGARADVETDIVGKVTERDYRADRELDVALREAAAINEGFSAPERNAPVNQLSPPLFSHASGSFPPSGFDFDLKLANPNPRQVSRLLYSLNDEDWQPYTGEPVVVGPNSKVRAYCKSLNKDWGSSPSESREFFSQVAALSPPLIRATAFQFDEEANRRISVAVANPNRNSVSRVEYRFGGSPWQVYREPVRLDGAIYSNAGVLVEARVVGVMGVSGRQSSDSVSLALKPSASGKMGTVERNRESESESDLELRDVDLAAPDSAHGYKAGESNVIEALAWGEVNGSGSFLLETFEAYRRYRDGSEIGLADSFMGQELGILGIGFQPAVSGEPDALLARRAPGGINVLEETTTNLFESTSAGIFQ